MSGVWPSVNLRMNTKKTHGEKTLNKVFKICNHSRHILEASSISWEIVNPLLDKTTTIYHLHCRNVCDCLGMTKQCRIFGAEICGYSNGLLE